MLEPRRVHHRIDVMRPGPAVGIGLGGPGLAGRAVAAQVVGHEVIVVGQLRIELVNKTVVALAEAMDEQDGRFCRDRRR